MGDILGLFRLIVSSHFIYIFEGASYFGEHLRYLKEKLIKLAVL